MPTPADLWTFWDRTREILETTPADPRTTPVPEHSTDEVLVRHVSLRSYEGRLVRAWYAAPPVPDNVRIAGLLLLPGYTSAPGVEEAVAWARRGYATLFMIPRGQGAGKPFPEGAEGKLVHEVSDPERYAYRSVFMDCLRGFDFLQARREVHPRNVAVAGGSQGGGLALATAALSEGRAAVVAAHVPFLCHYDWVIEHAVETRPYRILTDYLAERPEQRDAARRTLAYFDPVNLVRRIACPVLVTVGLKDTTCPRETVEAVFERIPTTKYLLVVPEMAHETPPHIVEHMKTWLAHHLD